MMLITTLVFIGVSLIIGYMAGLVKGDLEYTKDYDNLINKSVISAIPDSFKILFKVVKSKLAKEKNETPPAEAEKATVEVDQTESKQDNSNADTKV